MTRKIFSPYLLTKTYFIFSYSFLIKFFYNFFQKKLSRSRVSQKSLRPVYFQTTLNFKKLIVASHLDVYYH